MSSSETSGAQVRRLTYPTTRALCDEFAYLSRTSGTGVHALPLSGTTAYVIDSLPAACDVLAARLQVWRPTHRHYKGGAYREIARGVHLEADFDGPRYVLYDNAAGQLVARPLAEWTGSVPQPTQQRYAPFASAAEAALSAFSRKSEPVHATDSKFPHVAAGSVQDSTAATGGSAAPGSLHPVLLTLEQLRALEQRLGGGTSTEVVQQARTVLSRARTAAEGVGHADESAP